MRMLLLLALVLALAGQQVQAADISGTWQGTAHGKLVVKIAKASNG